MPGFFKKYPLATVIGWAVTVYAVLVALQGTHVLTGTAARWVDAAAGLLQVILTVVAKAHVTPVAAPKDNYGHKLVPASMQGPVGLKERPEHYGI